MSKSTVSRSPSIRPPGPSRESSASHYSTHADNLSHPFGFFHPTRAEFMPHPPPTEAAGAKPSKWSSRASRKNRYTPSVMHVRHHFELPTGKAEEVRKLQSELVHVEQRLRHPQTRLKVHLSWDVSFWVAVIFVLGSTAWIVNGFYLFLPLVNIGGDHGTSASWWAFAGGTLFEVGSYLMVVEAINTGHDELFGPSLWGLVSHSSLASSNESSLPAKENGRSLASRSQTQFRWVGLGSWRDLGFLACFVQVFAASIFWISTITGIPHVIPNLATSPPVAIADVFFWTPQVIGGIGFMISSLLLMFEVQTAWWKPNFVNLGWHVAVWNLVGAVGFMLCGALGYGALSSTKVNYQSVLATFWGSWAFLVGSVVQLWETLWREDPSQGRDSAS